MTFKKEIQVVRTETWHTLFLSTLRETGIIARAIEACGMSRQTVYNHYNSDDLFHDQWEKAIVDAAGLLEDEAWRRAHEGVNEPIIQNGQIIGFQRKYSDTLLIFLLKHIKPEKFGDKLMIRLDPDQAAILTKLNMTPAQAWQLFMENLRNEYIESGEVNDSSTPDTISS